MREAPVFLLFSGYNERAIIAFSRFLKKHQIRFVIIASSVNDPIFLSDFSENVCHVRKITELNFEEILCAIEACQSKIENANGFVYAPTTEALNRFFIEHREEFSRRIKIQIPLVDELLYKQVSDKKSFGELCKNAGLDIPGEFELSESVPFPIVAKPRTYLSKKGIAENPVIINSEIELSEFRSKFDEADFYLQQFIAGQSLYLLYYFNSSNVATKYSQRNLVQQSAGGSIVAAISSDIHTQKISEDFETLFKEIGFSGFVMVELKFFNGSYYMIEANPRFWGPSQLLVDGNSGLFEAFVANHGIPLKPEFIETQKAAKYFWFGGIVSELKQEKKLAFHEYEQNKLLKELKGWLQHDVYNRPDNSSLFLSELTK